MAPKPVAQPTPKPVNRPRTPEEIRQSFLAQNANRPPAEPSPTSTPSPAPSRTPTPPVGTDTGTRSTPTPVALPAGPSAAEIQASTLAYREQVQGALLRLWHQPASSELAGAQPVARIRLRIGRDGQVRQRELITPSGLVPMDQSVTRLLASLARLPAFPAALTDDDMVLEIALQVTD